MCSATQTQDPTNARSVIDFKFRLLIHTIVFRVFKLEIEEDERFAGVRTVETEVSSSKVMVTGSMDGEKLVEYVYRRTKKQAKIVQQPEPEPAPAVEPAPETAEKPKEEDAAGKPEEKPAEEAKPEEKPAEEEKKEGGGGGGGEVEVKKDGGEKMESMDMQRMMYYHQYPPLYVMERIPPPQLFSDENPNACCIS